MAEEALESARLLRWSGLALVAGGVLLAVATALHPSRETVATIIASEVRLVAAHVLYTLSSLLVLLGLPDSIWLSVAGWDGWDWQASWGPSLARI